MSDQSSSVSSHNPESAVQIIGETGGTVVYVFPGGDARVKKGKKLVERLRETAQATDSLIYRPDESIPSLTISPDTQLNLKKPRPKPLISSSLRQGGQANSGDRPKKSPSSHSGSKAASVASSLDTTTLGQKLIEAKLISEIQLQVATYDLQTSSMGLAEILIARGWVTKEAIAPFIKL